MTSPYSTPLIDVGWFSDKGPYRKRNEDVAFFDRENGIFIVSDGLGGAAAGDRAARVATDLMCFALLNELSPGRALEKALPDTELRSTIQNRVAPDFDVADPYDRMRFGFLLAHFGVLAEASRTGSIGMATAMVAAWSHEGGMLIGHVGDCRAYTLGEQGLELHTRDHSLSMMLAGRQALPKGAENSPFLRSRLTQVIGGEVNPSPDVCTWTAHAGSRVLLCSDGAWGSLDDLEFPRILGMSTSAESISRTFVEAAIEAGSRDNATALAALF